MLLLVVMEKIWLHKTASIRNVKTGKNIRVLKGHSGEVNSVAFSNDGKYLATGSWDKTARIWNVKSGK